MNRGAALLLVAAGLAGGAAIVLGAAGAHLVGTGDGAAQDTRLFDTALRYHLVHAVALLALAGLCILEEAVRLRRWLLGAGGFWVAGLLLFSGGLYLRALSGVSLGPLVPVGGTLHILGWLLVAGAGLAAALRRRA